METLTAAKLAEYRKAIGAFLGTAVAGAGALLALGVLSGPASHNLALGLAIATPVAGALGAAVAPKNGPKPPVELAVEDLIAGIEKAVGDARRVVAAAQVPLPTYTTEYGPRPPVEATFLGGVVGPEAIAPPG